MWYWGQENFEGMLEFAQAIAHDRDLALFGQYCMCREKGLRKEGFRHLGEFMQIAAPWPLAKRFAFVDSLYHFLERHEFVHSLIPQIMYDRLVEPTLQEWIAAYPEDPAGYRWLGGVENWRKAVIADANEQIARLKLIRRLIYQAYFSTHHLPDGYIGYPSEDMMGLDEAEGLYRGLTEADPKLLRSIGDYRELIQSYMDYKAAGSGEGFAPWAEKNGRPSHIPRTTV